MFDCNKCGKSFDKKHGLNVHFRRKHTAAGKTWGKGGRKRTSSSPSITARPDSLSIRQKVRRVLESHPHGLQVKFIIQQMKTLGYRPDGDDTGYISQVCSSDSNIERVQRGIYRLTNTPTNHPGKRGQGMTATPLSATPTPAPEAPEVEVENTVESLLVHIAHLEKERDALEKERNALRNAHVNFIREVSA